MSNNLKRLISLIPIENDDKFYGVYHRNDSLKKKMNLLLKKPLNLEISNYSPENYQLNYTLEKYGKKPNFLPKIPKVNLKFKQEEKLPYILTNIPTSDNSFIYHKPIEDEKSKIRHKIRPVTRKLTINNIIFQEDPSVQSNSISKSSSKLNIIFLERKKPINESTKNLIHKEYEKQLNQFKVYSKNMNEMIANQMALKFLNRTKELQKLKSDDLLVNYIQFNHNIKSRNKRKNSTSESNHIESDEIMNQNNSPNLIIHNVFFEWVISNVIQRYIDEVNPLNKNASIKFIRNLIIDEVKTLSTLFFFNKNLKKDEKDLPMSMRIVRNKFGKYLKSREKNGNNSKNIRKKDDIELQIDVEKEIIKQKLIEKIIERIAEQDEEKINKIEDNEINKKKIDNNEINKNKKKIENNEINKNKIDNNKYNNHSNKNLYNKNEDLQNIGKNNILISKSVENYKKENNRYILDKKSSSNENKHDNKNKNDLQKGKSK